MLLAAIAHVYMLSVVEISAQLMLLDDAQLLTPCTEGLRHGMDTVTINATIYNFTDFVTLGWDTRVTAEILTKGSSNVLAICVIEIGQEGQQCRHSGAGTCYCDSYDDITGDVELFISQAAWMNVSEGVIRLKWLHPSGNVVYSQNNQTLPRIYDVHNVTLVLKVNGKPVTEDADCNYNVISSAYNKIELCCTNSASPCYPRVRVKQFTFPGNISHCIRYDFMMHMGKFQSTMIKSYAVCSMGTFYLAGSCVATSSMEEDHSSNKLLFMILIIPVALIVYGIARLTHAIYIKNKETHARVDMQEISDKNSQAPYQGRGRMISERETLQPRAPSKGYGTSIDVTPE